jgi:hypothetical protein
MIVCVTPLLTASATTIQALNIEQRATRSDRIVVASVASVDYQKAANANRIYTITTLKVIEPIKGTAQKDMHLVVRQIGGQIGEWSQYVSGDARFEVGQEVVVFLRHDQQDDLHFLVGMAQGKIDVNLDADQVGIIAQPKTKTKPTVVKSHAHSSPEATRQTLSELIERIRLAAVVQTP